MKKTTKVVLMSVLAIAMCFSLIVGATFALFTSEDSVNIAVTSGKVKVEASASLDDAWSAKWNGTSYDRAYLLEKDGANNTAIFTTGGVATYKDGELKLDRIVPGDGVTAKIDLVNYSNVKIQYKVTIKVVNNTGLYEGLDLSFYTLNEADERVPFTSIDWLEQDIPENGSGSLASIYVDLELPISAGREYMETGCTIVIQVVAVQSNAHIVKDIALNGTLMNNVADAMTKANITSDSIVMGSYNTYKEAIGNVAFESGALVSDSGANSIVIYDSEARMFHAADGKIYVLSKSSMVAEASYNEPVFANSSFTNVDLSDVDFSTTTKIGGLFKGASKVETINMSGANLSKATDLVSGANLGTAYLQGARIDNVFDGCISLKSIDLSGANLSSMTDAVYGSGTGSGLTDMFYGCDALETVNLSGADLSGLTDMMYAFLDHENLISVDLSKANLCSATTLEGICQGSNNIQWVNLAGADLSNVMTMESMFAGKKKLQWVDLSDTDLSKITDVSGMFNGCSAIETVSFAGTNLSNVETMRQMFYYSTSIKSVDFSECDLSKVTDMQDMFYGCTSLETISFTDGNLSSLDRMYRMFYNCSNLASVDFSGLDLSNVTTMYQMFYRCSSLTEINFAGVDLSGGVDMYYTFDGCTKLEGVNFAGATICVTDAKGMFSNTAITSFDASIYDFSQITATDKMFSGCTKLTKVDFSNANLSSVKCQGGDYMQDMFSGCTSLEVISFAGADMSGVYNNTKFEKLTALKTIDFRGANLSNLTSGYAFLRGCTSLQTVYMWSDIKLTYTSDMFNGCSNLEHIYVADEVSLSINASSSSNMFAGCEKIHNWDGTITATRANTSATGYFEILK